MDVFVIVHSILFEECEVLFVLCVEANVWYRREACFWSYDKVREQDVLVGSFQIPPNVKLTQCFVRKLSFIVE